MVNTCNIDSYIDLRIEALRNEGRNVTANNYGKARRCLRRYCPNDELTFSDITEDFIIGFNAYLEKSKIQKATISFYNRVLRSIYNQAAKDGLVKNAHPFDSAYTKVESRLAPVPQLRDHNGDVLDQLSKEELARRYYSLQTRYNTLVNKLMAVVGN